MEGELRAYFQHLREQRAAAKAGTAPEFASASHIAAAIKLAFRKDDDDPALNPSSAAFSRARELARQPGKPPAGGLPVPAHEE